MTARQAPEPRRVKAGLFHGAEQRSEKVGKMPVREADNTEAIEQKTRFKTGWLVWSELGPSIVRPLT